MTVQHENTVQRTGGTGVTIAHDQLDDVDLYVSNQDIPWYQRSWAWGIAALVILICGLGIGWQLKPERLVALPYAPARGVVSSTDAAALLQIQKGVNAGLEAQIAELQQQENVCAPALSPGVARIVGQLPERPVQAGVPLPSPPADRSDRPTNNLSTLIEAATVQVVGAIDDTHLSTGTGFFISPDVVITNAHVVKGVRRGELRIRSAALNREVNAEVIAETSVSPGAGNRDYAILKALGANPANHFILSSKVDKLAPVKAAGYPGVYTQLDPSRAANAHTTIPEMVMRAGEVSVIHEFVSGIPVISHTASIFRGNSGGPLVDACGRVVGINTFGVSQLEDPNDESSAVRIDYAIGAADLLHYLDENVSKIGGPATRNDAPCN